MIQTIDSDRLVLVFFANCVLIKFAQLSSDALDDGTVINEVLSAIGEGYPLLLHSLLSNNPRFAQSGHVEHQRRP